MSDLEVVALNLTVEFISIDSKNSLFKQLNSNEIPIVGSIKEEEYCFSFQRKLAQSWLLIF